MRRAVGVARGRRLRPARAAAAAWTLPRPRRRLGRGGAGVGCRLPVPLPPAGAGGAAARALVDDGEQLADLDVLAFLPLDAGEHAALLGADLEIDLLGLELDDRLADLDAVALLLQPARDARLDDRFTELGTTMLDIDCTVTRFGRSVRLRGAGFDSTIGDSDAWLSRSNARSTSAF